MSGCQVTATKAFGKLFQVKPLYRIVANNTGEWRMAI